jgi:Domain of unknown function (DUF4352)
VRRGHLAKISDRENFNLRPLDREVNKERTKPEDDTAAATPNTLGGVFICIGRLAALLIVPVAVFLASCGLFHPTSAQAGMGQEVLDGKFAFIVTHVDTSPTFGQTRAQGVYVIVSMAVRNVGTEAQFFVMSAQKLKDNAGREYSAGLMDPPVLQEVNNINPGLQVSVKLAFDVPPGTTPTQILLHESVSSHGATVNLTAAPTSSSSSSPRV